MSTLAPPIEITILAKSGGPLTKRIFLDASGKLVSDGSACIMSNGTAHRVRFNGLPQFATGIASLGQNEAITLGAIRADLPDKVEVVTKRKLDELNGNPVPDIIARTTTYINYRPNQAALVLLDYDTKGMPHAVAARLDHLGGYWPALIAVVPELANVAHVMRRSTSTGLFRSDTGQQLPGSSGLHTYVVLKEGADAERFLKTLHDRCWLAGLGWMMVGAGGQLLERSIVDRMVGAAERLVFEGAPVLDPPLAQDHASRQPDVTEGGALDSLAACPPLTVVEQAGLRELRSKDAHRLASASAKAREAFVKEQSRRLAERTGMPPDDAAEVIARQCNGVLLPHVLLPFDDADLAGSTVADVLADPARFEDATLADPLEGVEYGTCKAKIMRRADGTPWIHSFAHGRTVYELKLDAAAVRTILDKTTPTELIRTFVRLALAADLSSGEQEEIRNSVSQRTGITKTSVSDTLKAAKQEQAQQRAREEQHRRAAERQDPRPQIDAPPPDAPWLPQMQALNDVLGKSTALEPPARDIDGVIAQVRVRRVPNMHALTPLGSNEEETEKTRLPPPEQPLLTRLDKTQLAELIERHIEYVDPTGRPVHLAGSFVEHFHTRTDDALPIVAAVATLPLVLGDGTLLASRGLDRRRGIVFRVAPELMALLPTRELCDVDAVYAAFKFLTDEWLVDVAADFTGKCTLIAAALTVIERSLLPERPAFFVTAGRRGGGKTTTLIMLLMAVTGVRPSAAAWSPNQEERRKALLAYLLEALAAIVWDNIPRGTQISCPHVEKSCTTAFYSDRRLGVSEMVAVAASVIHFFTGNNIGPRGDLASRSLQVRLEVERADPENRPFKHPDPIGWTEANRGKILVALYTILLGNPALDSNQAPRTRFKTWWRHVGSAVEHAAQLAGEALDFQPLVLAQEEDDDESASLTDALSAIAAEWTSGPPKSADIARMINDQGEYRADAQRERAATLREFLFPTLPPNQTVTAKSVGKRLKRHVGEPVKRGDNTLCLKEWREPNGGPNGPLSFYVHV